MSNTYRKVHPPADGEKIIWSDSELVIPDRPIIPFIEGDGIGADVWRATLLVVDRAVEKAYGTSKSIAWTETFAG